jgi:hypothetical protein
VREAGLGARYFVGEGGEVGRVYAFFPTSRNFHRWLLEPTEVKISFVSG